MAEVKPEKVTSENINFDELKHEVINDYQLAVESRETSLLGRREVLTGKAKFGIFGDGKELAQVALSKQFKDGDFRSGYYRDQTIMLAIKELTIEQFFSGLYASCARLAALLAIPPTPVPTVNVSVKVSVKVSIADC